MAVAMESASVDWKSWKRPIILDTGVEVPLPHSRDRTGKRTEFTKEHAPAVTSRSIQPHRSGIFLQK